MAEKINVSICIVYYIYLYYGISNDSICIGNKISRDTLHFPAAFTMIFESIYHIGYYTITNAYTDKYIVILSVSGCEYNLNYVVAVVVHQFPCQFFSELRLNRFAYIFKSIAGESTLMSYLESSATSWKFSNSSKKSSLKRKDITVRHSYIKKMKIKLQLFYLVHYCMKIKTKS